MPTLFFPDRETLRLVVASGGVAPSISGTPAAAGFDAQGRVWLSTSAWLPREALVALQRYGVQVLGAGSAPATEKVSCWHELIPLEAIPVGPSALAGTVLFECPGHSFAELAGEIERLGRGPWSYRWLSPLEDEADDDRVLIKTTAPPYCTLLRVLDRPPQADGVVAYMEQAPCVWVAAGFRHPLAEQIQLPAKQALFLSPPNRWEWREERPFATPTARPTELLAEGQSIPGARSMKLPARIAFQAAIDVRPGKQANSVPVALRFVPVNDEAPAEMWLIRDQALAWLEQFVHATDQRLLGRFSFAIFRSDEQPCLVLRAHRTKEPPPVLVGTPTGYRPILKLANLWLPCGFKLSPSLRRSTLRQLFCPDPNRLTWLRSGTDGGFHAESLPQSAFRLLKDCLEYRVEEARPIHTAWRPSTALEFERFELIADLPRRTTPRQPQATPTAEAIELPAAKSPPKKAGKFDRVSNLFASALNWLKGASAAESPPAAAEAAPIPMSLEASEASSAPPTRSISPATKVEQANQRAQTLKAQFLSSVTKLSRPDRLYFWPELAAAFAEANNPAEAAICWLNALWEREQPSSNWAWGWLRAESAQAGWNPNNVRLADWLNAEPKAARVRCIAAYALWATLQTPMPAGFNEHVSSLQAYLEANEPQTPVRAVWLAQTALARVMRGDVLTLAQTRDRLFARMHQEGLSLDLDAPIFVRYGESDAPDRLDAVRKRLMDKRKLLNQWIARLSPENADRSADDDPFVQCGLQAEVRCTQAYADLMLAWGLARLGEKTEGARLRDQAWQELDDADPIHTWLKSAFDFRIRQAREGKDSVGPLPEDLLGRLDGLSDDQRYRIDRLRQHSKILDPSERIDAYWASTYRRFPNWDRWRKKVIDLPSLKPSDLNGRVRQILAEAAAESSTALPIVMNQVLDRAQHLERSLGEKALELLPTALDLAPPTTALQLRLFEKGLLFAASFDRPSAIQPLFQRFVGFVEKQRGRPASVMLEGLTGQTFRCLRRLGMKREAYDILGQVHGFLTGGEDIPVVRDRAGDGWPNLARTLLHVAAAFCYCGQEDPGLRIINPVRDDLYGRAMPPAERTALAITYASVLGYLKVPIAMGRFEEMFQRLKGISVGGWNSHYTRAPLELLDTALVAVVSDDFTLGPSVRGWLDDDEYLVRQRIHLELKELMRDQGI